MVKLNSVLGEPWRCACPECSSYEVVRMTTDKRPSGKRYEVGGRDHPEAKYDRSLSWRCDSCNKRLATVFDKKQDEQIPIDHLVHDDGMTVRAI